MNKTDQHKVALKISEFPYSVDNLTTMLGLQPSETAVKDQEYFIGPPHRKIPKRWPFNFWMYQESVEKDQWYIGDQITNFISKIIVPRISILNEIKENCEFELGVSQCLYTGCNPGFHLDKKELKILADIDCEIDIDFYVLSGSTEDPKGDANSRKP